MYGLRILYSFPLRVGSVGPGMTAWHHVTGLIGQSVQVYLCAASCERKIRGLKGLNETLVSLGIKLPVRLIGRRRAMEIHDRKVAKTLYQIQDRYRIDLVHCWPSGAKETLLAARERGIKTLLERPNTHTRYAMNVVRQECARLGIKLPKSHSHVFDDHRLRHEEEEFELADRLLCPSRFVLKTFLDMGFKKEKMSLHQYGFDPSLFNISAGDLTKVDEAPFSMVFLGSCEPRKGLHYALEAWLSSKASRDGIFYICGKYVRGYRKLLASKLAHPSVKELDFSNNIAPLLRKCHALILPSIEEGSALVTYEARACGCVLLVSAVSGAKCQHMKNSLVHKPGDVDTLSRHIDMLASNRALFFKLRKDSLAGVKDLTWESAIQSLIKAYRQCLNENNRSPQY
jgi:glycosyltransferase involved in cell wall biosynthesis